MARSSYVYAVYDYARERVVAGFTVKHELVTWLTGHEDPHRLLVSRMRDGGWGGDPVKIPIEDLLP